MFFPRIAICVILMIFTTDSTQSEISSGDTIETDTSIEQFTDPSATIASDISSNTSTITDEEHAKKPSISTDHDIQITGHITPSPFSDEADFTEVTIEANQTTEFDNFNDTSEVTTTIMEIIETESVCSLNPCRNNGICIEDVVLPSLFSCLCEPGYTGIRCGTVDKCVEDEEYQLCKNGACVYSKDGLLRSCQCFTGMYWSETDKECRDSVPPCFPNPCKNGGICTNEMGRAHCDCPSGYTGANCTILLKCGDCEKGMCVMNDEQTMKYCKCNDGLYWNEEQQKCEVIMPPCYPNPCLNGGICDSLSQTEFNCTCQMGFSGKKCEVTDKCSDDNDCGQGACALSDDGKFRRCQCNKDFYLDDQLHICKEMTNICQPNPCLNDGICTVASASTYNCTCSQGYNGKRCEVRDLCEMDGGNAFCGNGMCRNNYGLGIYFCICNEREYFRYSQRKCVELDMCPLVRCDSMETCVMGECKCKEHYKRDNDTQKCLPDFCSENPCPLSEMICEEGTGERDYKCSCPDGYSFNGTHCSEAVCLFPELNPCSQNCSAKEESEGYECSCAEGFVLNDDNHTCSYTGNMTCSNKTCDNGICIKEDDTEEICICPPGFTEIDGMCKDKCSAGDLMPGICPSDECEVTNEGGFRCKCEGKYTLSKDKTTCMVRNICNEKEVGWKTCTDRNAECIVDFYSTNGYKCVCANGQVPTEGGICRDVCSLENNQRQCSIRGATCDVDEKGNMICKCPPYFKENEGNRKCTRPADFSYLITLPLDKSTYLTQNRKKRSLDPSVDYRKISSDVTVTMRDMFTSFKRANILSCKTISEYLLCKIELQFASEVESDLKRLQTEGNCLGNGVSNSCLLPPSLVLVKNKIIENVRIQQTNPCEEEIKNEVCGLETTCISALSDKSFNCSCKPGFFMRRKTYPFGDTRSFIEICSDIDECAEGNPCPDNSNCLNTIGSYTCSCKPGYRNIKDESGADSQKCLEICHPNPCTHGHCSRRGEHEFDCRCDAGYAGTLCDLQDEHFKSARINTIIVGVVLGGALLITFILFAACVSRLRKQKMLENPERMLYSSTEMRERRHAEGGAVNNAFQRE